MRCKRGSDVFLLAFSAILGVGLAVATPATASDGVIEINQVRARAGGVTPGDTPLFPVTISLPGSYRLTSNLDVTDASARPGGTLAENTTAILVTADNVTIDLNGFTIKGPAVCSGAPLACTPTGSGKGIDASAQTGVKAMNGTVRGMGFTGVSLLVQALNASLAEKIVALSNGGLGIEAVVVTHCTAESNGGKGIRASTAANCEADGNGGDGIIVSAAVNCTTRENLGGGIKTVLATGCYSEGNVGGDLVANGIAGQNICGIVATACP